MSEPTNLTPPTLVADKSPIASTSPPSIKDSSSLGDDKMISKAPSQDVSSVEKLMILTEEAHEGGFWAHRKCTFLAMVMYLCSFTLGYELGVINSFLALPSFIEKFGSLDSTTGKKVISVSLQQGLFALWRVGAIVALVFIWWAYAYIGRVRVFQIGLLVFLLAIIIEAAAPNTAVFMVGRFLIGVGDALTSSGSFLWIAECTAAQLRNASGFIYAIKTAAGVIIAFVVARACSHGTTPKYYQIPLLVGLAPQTLSCLLTVFLPESPRWLASQGRIEEARKSLIRLRGKRLAREDLIENELQSIIAALKLERSLQGSLTTWQMSLLAFKGTNKRRTLLALATATFFVFCGYEFCSHASSYLFKAIGETDPFKYLIVIKATALLGSIIGLFVADRVRRRPLLIGSFSLCFISMVGIAVSSTITNLTLHAHIVCLTIFTSLSAMVFYGGIFTTLFTVTIELPSQILRAWTYSVVYALSLLISLVNDLVQPKIINTTGLNWGGKYAYVFIVTSFLITVWVWFFLPETAGVTLEEMDLLFEHRVEPRKFRKWAEEHRRLQNEEDRQREA